MDRKIVMIAVPMMDYVDQQLVPVARDFSLECPPNAVYLLAHLLCQEGYNCEVIDLIAEGTNVIVNHERSVNESSLIGISANSLNWPTALDVIKQIRKINSEVPIVVGGVHPSLFDKYILRNYDVDYVIRGEGEEPIVLLVRALEMGTDLSAVPNLTWRSKYGIIRNPTQHKLTVESLNALPVPDFSILKKNIYKGLSIESSRGCAYNCAFCSTMGKQNWRGLSPEIFLRKFLTLNRHIEKTTHKIFHIADDEFTQNPKRVIKIAELLNKASLKPKFIYDARANDLLHEGFIETLSVITHRFLLGAECGYDEGLSLIGKGITVSIIERVAKLLYKHGISEKADFSFILGLPWEDKEKVTKTIQFGCHLFATYGVRILFQWYCQMPGSRLWYKAEKEQIVSPAMYDHYGFFRNLYIFRSGVKLLPKDIWDISRMIEEVRGFAELTYPNRVMIEHAIPVPIYENFTEKELIELQLD